MPAKNAKRRERNYMKQKFALNIIFLAFACLGLSCNLSEKSKINQGNEIVNKIENYRKEKGVLPTSLSEVGIEEKEDSVIHYKKESETKFILWFGTTLGESTTYDSETKNWK